MSGFVEIQPTQKGGNGTGVKLGINDRSGLILSLSGEALAALGGGEPGPFKAFLNLDPALPMLRLERHLEGRFRLTAAQRGETTRLIRLGHQAAFVGREAKGLACSWEAVDGRPAIDIDLPRELMRAETVAVRRPGASEHSKPITLPKVAAAQGAR